jgi:hypothetical protein
MEQANRYLTGMVLAILAIVFGGFYFLRGAVKTVQQIDPDISYSMPRPTKNAIYRFLFGLEGREVEYKEIDPFKGKKKVSKDSLRKDQKTAPKIDPKKAVAKTQTPNPAAAPKKPEVKVNVVNDGPAANGLRGSGDADGGVQSIPISQIQTRAANPNANQDPETLSPAQWRALVVGQPTKENVAKLIDAFNKKEVDADTLYLIMNDLFHSSNAETQGQALTIAQQIPSLRSFTVVADNYDKLDNSVKGNADKYLLTYAQGSRISILALALQSSDSQVSVRAAQVLNAGLAQAKPGTDGTVRPGRGVVASGQNNAYKQLIPILQNLTKGSDATLAGLAQNALTQIQALSNA